MFDDDRPHSLLDRFDTRAFIAILLTMSMIALTFVLALKGPETDAFKVLLGAMLTVGFASAIGWYFNSSAGSDKKDATQAKVAEKLAEKVPLMAGTGNGAPPATVVTTAPTEPSTTPTTTTVTTQGAPPP
jgi:hypothetical protein